MCSDAYCPLFMTHQPSLCKTKTIMTRDERYKYVLEYFRSRQPEITTELEFGSVFQLLVAVILSAQCTDKRVNMVTPELFRAYPDAAAMASADEDEVFEYVRSVSYPRSKASHLVAMSRLLMDEYGGEVPEDEAALLRLPGVGRKTANVMRAVAFGFAAMPVDTHVYRVSHRLGLVSTKDNTPEKVEKALTKHIPTADVARAHHWLLLHGRYVCTSRQPHCDRCDLEKVCPKLIDGSKLQDRKN